MDGLPRVAVGAPPAIQGGDYAALRVIDGVSGSFIRLYRTRETVRNRPGQRPPGVCKGTGVEKRCMRLVAEGAYAGPVRRETMASFRDVPNVSSERPGITPSP
jgi:hypothetical protein